MLKRSNVITNKSIIITPFVLIIETIKKLSTVSLKKRRFPSRVYDCYRIRWNVGEITRADANNVYIFANAPAESISNNHSRRPIAECEDLIDWNSIGIRLEFDFQCSKCRKQLCNAAIACVFLLSQMKILFWCQYRYANPNFPKFHPQFTLVAAVSLSLSLDFEDSKVWCARTGYRIAESETYIWQELLTCSCSTVNVAAILAQHADMPAARTYYFQSRYRVRSSTNANILLSTTTDEPLLYTMH